MKESGIKTYVVKNQKRLRCGITTGTCGAAAAQAAVKELLLGYSSREIEISTPKGIRVRVPLRCSLRTENCAEYRVVKDSGDDPDVTDQMELYVLAERISDKTKLEETVFWTEEWPGLYLDGGEGIGRVTRPGLEQRVGQAAINKVPRAMMFRAAGEICRAADYQEPLLLTIWAPRGEELAKRTFNPRLGILGGLSILGTSGIVEPMSEKAIVDTIEAEIRQKKALGERRIFATPGSYGQGYAADYLGVSLEKSIKCSNYLGETLDLAVSYGIEELLLIGNAGKLVKLAAGIMNTHSKTADGRQEIFALHTVLCGGTREMAQRLMECINTEEMLSHLTEWGLRENVMRSILGKIEEHVQCRTGDSLLCGVLLFSEKYGFLGQTRTAQRLLAGK